MTLQDCYFLGTIIKKHGLKGHLIIKLDTDSPEIYSNLESVWVEKDHMLIPFFLKECSLLREKSLRVLFDADELTTESLLKKPVYLPLSSLPELPKDRFYYHEIIGFAVKNENNISIGNVSFVTDTEKTAQEILFVDTPDGKEVLIPLVDEWIIEINKKEKFIQIKIPEGLLDL